MLLSSAGSAWSLTQRAMVAELETVSDMYADRLALCRCELGPIVVAGAWARYGVEGYTLEGAVVWTRPDLKKNQGLIPVGRGDLVAVVTASTSLHVLDVASGETVAKLRDVQYLCSSVFSTVALAWSFAKLQMFDATTWTSTARIPSRSYLRLAAAGGPDWYIRSEKPDTGELCTVNVTDLDGREQWRWTLPPGHNCPALAWDTEAGTWLGVLSDYSEGGPSTLIRWAPDGTVIAQFVVTRALSAFLAGGRWLVSGDGAVIDTRDASVAWQYAAPTT